MKINSLSDELGNLIFSFRDPQSPRRKTGMRRRRRKTARRILMRARKTEMTTMMMRLTGARMCLRRPSLRE